MDNIPQNSTFLNTVLKKTGGWYLTLAIIVTQTLVLLGPVVAGYAIQVNAEFSPEKLMSIIRFSGVVVLAANAFLIMLVFFLYGDARKGLARWKISKDSSTDFEDNIAAWNQITPLAWRYSFFVFIVCIFLVIVPVLAFQIFVLKVTNDQLIYTSLGIFAAALTSTSLSLLLLDHLLRPAREALLPKDFKNQLLGTNGVNLTLKLQTVILALILISILLIAPIGYHQMVKALETGRATVLKTMQVQSILSAVLIIGFGALLSSLVSQSISSPLHEIIKTFNRIEEGDLKQRARVTEADEVGELAVYFNRMVSQLDNLQSGLETQIANRTEQLRATFEVGRVISSILDPDELIEKVANLISERLGYYYAAIFIVSPDGAWAELRSATGEAGQALLASKHRLVVGGNSMVGSAISLREARIAHDTGLEAVRFNNPLLPDTRSEIALPLIAGGRVLGALDAQSVSENAFDQANTETLQGVASQVAVALENARLYQETQLALREIRASQRTQLSQGWGEVLDSEGSLEFSIGGEQVTEGEDASFTVPLTLRDQTIGEISIGGDENWTADDEHWVEAIARQTAFAIENARLLEESQRTALQERLVAEINAKIWSSTTIDGILQVAITELGRTLSASEAVIKLDSDE